MIFKYQKSLVFSLHVKQLKYVNDGLYLDIHMSSDIYVMWGGLVGINCRIFLCWPFWYCLTVYSKGVCQHHSVLILDSRVKAWLYHKPIYIEDTMRIYYSVILLKLRLTLFFWKENILSVCLQSWVKVSNFIILQYNNCI